MTAPRLYPIKSNEPKANFVTNAEIGEAGVYEPQLEHDRGDVDAACPFCAAPIAKGFTDRALSKLSAVCPECGRRCVGESHPHATE